MSLAYIGILAYVQVVDNDGFAECISLCEFIFPVNNQRIIISGFHYCTSFARLEIPTSINCIDNNVLPTPLHYVKSRLLGTVNLIWSFMVAVFCGTIVFHV
jgi:hypothetical protein